MKENTLILAVAAFPPAMKKAVEKAKGGVDHWEFQGDCGLWVVADNEGNVSIGHSGTN